MTFVMNGRHWVVIFVHPYNSKLIDRTGTLTLATTDPKTNTVYISNQLRGGLLKRVVKHELAHCVMVSYGLIGDIYRMTKPEHVVDMEEWCCNLIADYSKEIYIISTKIINEGLA